jgi:hypothetical protein
MTCDFTQRHQISSPSVVRAVKEEEEEEEEKARGGGRGGRG